MIDNIARALSSDEQIANAFWSEVDGWEAYRNERGLVSGLMMDMYTK